MYKIKLTALHDILKKIIKNRFVNKHKNPIYPSLIKTKNNKIKLLKNKSTINKILITNKIIIIDCIVL